MRVVVEIFREPDGRLEGTLRSPDGTVDAFTSTLDLLRVLEGLDLPRPPSWEAGPLESHQLNPQPKESHG
jgi:hypothetical protein